MRTVKKFVRKVDGNKVVGWKVAHCRACERIRKKNKVLRMLGNEQKFNYCLYHGLLLGVLRAGQVKEIKSEPTALQIIFEVGKNSKIITVTIDSQTKKVTISNDKKTLKLQPEDLLAILENKKVEDKLLLDVVVEQMEKAKKVEEEIINA